MKTKNNKKKSLSKNMDNIILNNISNFTSPGINTLYEKYSNPEHSFNKKNGKLIDDKLVNKFIKSLYKYAIYSSYTVRHGLGCNNGKYFFGRSVASCR